VLSAIVAQSGAAMAEIAAGLLSRFAAPGRSQALAVVPAPVRNCALGRDNESYALLASAPSIIATALVTP
jgi:hypothetical protein